MSGEVKETVFKLRDFIDAAGQRLQLSIAAAGDMNHIVIEPMMYRPGLALTGFFGNFAWKRLQVIGRAERDYLYSLDDKVRLDRFRELFNHNVYCLIYACGFNPSSEIVELAVASGVTILKTPLLTREFIHQGTFVLETLRAPSVRLYGTTVEVAGLGVMMEGAPGLGKSETALGLIKHGNALVADDLTCLRRDVATGKLFASASDATRDYMEIRGIGLIHVPSIFGVSAVRGEKQLDLVITFKRMSDVAGELDRVGEDRFYKTILGVKIPELVIPVSAGRDLVNLVETAAQQFKLRKLGRDAGADLDARLRARQDAAK